MNDRETIKKQCDWLQDTLVKAGISTRTVFDEKANKIVYDWTPDGLRLRDAVLKAYDLIAKRQSNDPAKDLTLAINFTFFRVHRG
jgi:DNA-binding HxlR family transcriptional regulator